LDVNKLHKWMTALLAAGALASALFLMMPTAHAVRPNCNGSAADALDFDFTGSGTTVTNLADRPVRLNVGHWHIGFNATLAPRERRYIPLLGAYTYCTADY
jgi:hypothetical protein